LQYTDPKFKEFKERSNLEVPIRFLPQVDIVIVRDRLGDIAQ